MPVSFARIRALTTASLLLAWLGAADVRAQAPPVPTTTDPAADELAEKKRIAGAHFVEGNTLFEKDLYMAAVEAYKRSYEVYPLPITVYNIAKCYERMGAWDDCVAHYDRYIQEHMKANSGQEPKDARDVRASIDKCRLQTYPEVTFESQPVGANVWLMDLKALAVERPGLDPDGYDLEKLIKEQELAALGQTPLTVRWAPGLYTLFVRKDSNDDKERYRPFRMELNVRGGEKQYFNVPLERYRREGVVRIKANVRKASIFVDGKNIGLTPYDGDYRLEEGVHQITIDKDEYQSVNRELEILDGQKYDVEAELWLRDPPSTWKNGLGWASLVIGVLAVGGGGASSWFADRQLQGTSKFEVAKAFEQGGYIGGGILIGFGVALLIWEGVDKQFVKEGDLIAPNGGTTAKAAAPTVVPVVDIAPTGGQAGVRVGF